MNIGNIELAKLRGEERGRKGGGLGHRLPHSRDKLRKKTKHFYFTPIYCEVMVFTCIKLAFLAATWPTPLLTFSSTLSPFRSLSLTLPSFPILCDKWTNILIYLYLFISKVNNMIVKRNHFLVFVRYYQISWMNTLRNWSTLKTQKKSSRLSNET